MKLYAPSATQFQLQWLEGAWESMKTTRSTETGCPNGPETMHKPHGHVIKWKRLDEYVYEKGESEEGDNGCDNSSEGDRESDDTDEGALEEEVDSDIDDIIEYEGFM